MTYGRTGRGRGWRKKTEDGNVLLADYRRWLYYMAYRLSENASQVDDLAQEGYIAMWRALQTYDPDKGALPTWLTKSARLRMEEVLRRGTSFGKPEARGVHTTPESAGLPRNASLELAQELGLDPAAGDDVMEEVFARYMEGEVRRALDELPELQRRYVELRFWKGKSETQMYAEQLFPPGTVVRNLWVGKDGAQKRLRLLLGGLAA